MVIIETPIVDGGVYRTYQDGKLVETDLDPDYTIKGSGVLVEGGYIITSHLFVWPYSAMRVTFPDGSAFEDVPVLNFDPLSGLAVLGPIDAPALPLKLADGEDTAIGSNLFLIVYPEGNGKFSQPVMGRGTLQDLWETKRAGITYLEAGIEAANGYAGGMTDNTAPTSVGGALVTGTGELIGISVHHTRKNFALAASASDVAPIAAWLIRGEIRTELGDRRPPSSGGQFQFAFETRGDWERHWRGDTSYYRRFLVQEPVGTVVKIELTGHGFERAFTLQDSQGRAVLRQQTLMGVGEDSGSVTLQSAGLHFLTVRHTTDSYLDQEKVLEQFGKVQLGSNVRLTPLRDPDDGRELSVGETVAGNGDAPHDRDWFRVRLEEGETVVVSGESVTSDLMMIDLGFLGARENQKVRAEVIRDSSAVIMVDYVPPEAYPRSPVVYRAPHAGEFFIDVSAPGGYYLSVEEASAGSEPLFIPPSPRVEGEVEGPFGPMTVYKSGLGGFSIQVPAGWEYGMDEKYLPFAEYYG